MTFNVGSWKGVFDAQGTRANRYADEVVIKFPANELREISFYLGNLRNVWPLVNAVY